LRFFELQKGERRRKLEEWFLGNSHRALVLLGILGSGTRKLQGFLELGSRSGCSYLDGRLIFSLVKNKGKNKNKIRQLRD
jgi:hypothetical protein